MSEKKHRLPIDVVARITGEGHVAMTTTEADVREEMFVDPEHAVRSTKRDARLSLLKSAAAGVIFVVSAFLAATSAPSLKSDLDRKVGLSKLGDDAQPTVIETGFALGGLLYGRRQWREAGTRRRQVEAAISLTQGTPSQQA